MEILKCVDLENDGMGGRWGGLVVMFGIDKIQIVQYFSRYVNDDFEMEFFFGKMAICLA